MSYVYKNIGFCAKRADLTKEERDAKGLTQLPIEYVLSRSIEDKTLTF